MRPLGEIIEDARDGKRPSADECYFAMLALAFVTDVFYRRKIGVVAIEYARLTDPQQYLGDDVPGNVAYDARRLADLVKRQQVDKVLEDPEILQTLWQLGVTLEPPPSPPAWFPTDAQPGDPPCSYCGKPSVEQFRRKYYCAGCAIEYAIAEQQYNAPQDTP